MFDKETIDMINYGLQKDEEVGNFIDDTMPKEIQITAEGLTIRSYYNIRYDFNKAGYNLYNIRPHGFHDVNESKIVLVKKDNYDFEKDGLFILSEEEADTFMKDNPNCLIFDHTEPIRKIYFAVGLNWKGWTKDMWKEYFGDE